MNHEGSLSYPAISRSSLHQSAAKTAKGPELAGPSQYVWKAARRCARLPALTAPNVRGCPFCSGASQQPPRVDSPLRPEPTTLNKTAKLSPRQQRLEPRTATEGPAGSGVLVGNYYDKYGTDNPIERRLMSGFLRVVSELYQQVAPKTVLEIGCGEGLLAQHLLSHGPRPERFEACDLSLERLAPDLDPIIQFRAASIYDLPWEDGAFDLVVCCEVLEHLTEPERGLREVARVCRRAAILSTPREPLWRLLNILRGSYWSDFGNTPGHLQHFTRRGLEQLVSQALAVQQTLSPLPWTVVLGTPKSRQTSDSSGCPCCASVHA